MAALVVGIWLPVMAVAGGGAAGGGATEVTQIANNAQLLKEVANTAKTVQHVFDQLNLAKQNLWNVPKELLEQAGLPYLDQASDLVKLSDGVRDLYTAVTGAEKAYQRRIQEIQTMAKSGFSLGDYIKNEMSLAQTKGSLYEKEWKADIAALDNVAERSKQLGDLTSKIPQVQGQLQGIQLLNQQASMLAGEMMEVKAALLKQNARAAESLRDDAQAKTNALLMDQRAADLAAKAKARDATPPSFTSSYRSSSGNAGGNGK